MALGKPLAHREHTGKLTGRSLPGQLGIPKLVLRTPEPLGSSSGAASSLLGRSVLFSFPQVPRAPIPGPCSHSLSSPCCCLPLPGAHTPETSSPGPSANPTPGIFTDHGLGRLGRPGESSPTPFDREGDQAQQPRGLPKAIQQVGSRAGTRTQGF